MGNFFYLEVNSFININVFIILLRFLCLLKVILSRLIIFSYVDICKDKPFNHNLLELI